MESYERIILEQTEVVNITDLRQLFEKNGNAKFFVPECSEELFKEISDANPHIKLNLIDRVLEIIMPVLEETATREWEISSQVSNWQRQNRNLVGHAGGPSTAYIVPDGANGFNILGPEVAIVLAPRWNAFQANRPRLPRQPRHRRVADFPQVAPNFVIELRSESDTALDVDRKMNKWIVGGVEEGISIDPYTNIIRIYTYDATLNMPACQKIHGCTPATQITSQILPGFVLSMQYILS